MTTQALFVDLSNFYSHLLESDIEEPRFLRDYFLEWFDFDRLTHKLTGEYSPVWVFYSGRRFGPKPNRIEGKYLDEYIKRVNSLRRVTAYDVDIPGTQREKISYECEKCGHKGRAQWETEKGIDASLTVRLFDTMDTWDVAYLLSADADFIPVVASLRQRGKTVMGAGFPDASSSGLIRECDDYVDLGDVFLKKDVAAYTIFKKDGIIQKWLTGEVQSSNTDLLEPIEFGFEWQRHLSNQPHVEEIFKQDTYYYLIYLMVDGRSELSDRHKQIEDFKDKFPDHVIEMDLAKGRYTLGISQLQWNGVVRRLETFISSLKISHTYSARMEGKGYLLKYQHNDETGNYELITNS
jgi:uncharacterized LabA/DUF88 family protein